MESAPAISRPGIERLRAGFEHLPERVLRGHAGPERSHWLAHRRPRVWLLIRLAGGTCAPGGERAQTRKGNRSASLAKPSGGRLRGALFERRRPAGNNPRQCMKVTV